MSALHGSEGLSPAKQLLLERRLRGELPEARPDPGIQRRPPGAPPVLSPGQRRLWFLHQLDPATAAYNMYQAVRLTGPLDPEVLGRCIDEVVRRHEVLRTTFRMRGGSPESVVSQACTCPLPLVDLRSLPEPDREPRARAFAAEEVRRAFDLGAEPPLRTTLLRLAETDHVLVLTIHHIASDEWSLGVFWREIAALYQALLAGRPSPLPDSPIQYADYAHRERERLARGEMDAHLAYWRRQLAGLPTLGFR